MTNFFVSDDFRLYKTFALIGSRTFDNQALIESIFETYLLPQIKTVVSGGAKGADQLSANIAKRLGIRTQIIRPKWRTDAGIYNPSAGFDRNKIIIQNAEAVWAFWNLYSNGTLDSIKTAIKLQKPVWVTTPSAQTFRLQQDWEPKKHLLIILPDNTLSNLLPNLEINESTLDKAVFRLNTLKYALRRHSFVATLPYAVYIDRKDDLEKLALELASFAITLSIILQ